MNALVAQLVLLQVVIPFSLLLLNACLPSGSRLGLSLRSLMVALVLLCTAGAGLWLFPPWWTPYALLVLHLGGTAVAWRRQSSRPVRRTRLAVCEVALAALALAAIGVAFILVLKGRSVPGTVIDLAQPLAPGSYLVVNGGSTRLLNAHLATLALARASAYRGQSHAVDIISIDRFGLRASGLAPRDPTRYLIHGVEVRAPCSGEVAHLEDGHADMPVPETDREHMLGNGVLLTCSGYHVLLAHFTPGSLRVVLGEQVQTGQPLGLAGNSGNSNEPHLHVHVQRDMPAGIPLAGEPLWFTIDGQFLARNSRFVVEE